MNFKQYAEISRKREHEKVLREICETVNNCGACACDASETGNPVCNWMDCIPVYDVTKNSFYMDVYSPATNRQLASIAIKNSYTFSILPDCKGLKFERRTEMKEKAIEKQIPKKVVDDMEFGKCPTCGHVFNSELINEYEIKYCPYCGQALEL